jgi:hypothetical protein
MGVDGLKLGQDTPKGSDKLVGRADGVSEPDDVNVPTPGIWR